MGDPASGKLWEGPPQIVEPTVPGGAAGSQGSSSIEGLLLYQPAVDEFQVWHLVIPGGSKGLDYVMDPGPGVLLVTGGNGNAVAKAGVVKSSALTDETELHPGRQGSYKKEILFVSCPYRDNILALCVLSCLAYMLTMDSMAGNCSILVLSMVVQVLQDGMVLLGSKQQMTVQVASILS